MNTWVSEQSRSPEQDDRHPGDQPACEVSRETETPDAVHVPRDFPTLFAEHFDYVWHALRRLGVPQADLEDVAHDVFFAIFRKLDQYDPGRPLRPWLFGFAFRFAFNYRELARNRLEVVSHDTDRRDDQPSALESAIQRESLRIASDALAALEIDRRAVFILNVLDDCPMPEVARALGIPLNTAYSRLRLARADLANAARRLRFRR